ncbi:MAG TPA: CHAD domain-containing protein [Pyrinomonadaceae bacterium]|nr:CHAD domain-containing protein [Pyrinomonadaceae bacterium]
MAGSKQITGIDCDGAAADGLRLALTTRLEQMLALRDYALDWSDPEGVHQMRVASRRLRSSLKDFQPHLPRHSLTSSRREIKALADALGSVRDQDVAIMALEELAAEAPAEISAGVQSIADLRRASLESARQELSRTLTEETLNSLRSQFAKALVAATARASGGKRTKIRVDLGSLNYRSVARSIILDRLKELEGLSNSLYHPFEVRPLHRMRLAAKQFRYALELFEQCWGSPLTVFSKKVAALQTSLGKLHDCDVWIESFGHVLDSETPESDFSRRRTSVWLIGHFVRMRAKHFNQALRQWNEWEEEGFGDQLRRAIDSEVMIEPGRTTGERAETPHR